MFELGTEFQSWLLELPPWNVSVLESSACTRYESRCGFVSFQKSRKRVRRILQILANFSMREHSLAIWATTQRTNKREQRILVRADPKFEHNRFRIENLFPFVLFSLSLPGNRDCKRHPMRLANATRTIKINLRFPPMRVRTRTSCASTNHSQFPVTVGSKY